MSRMRNTMELLRGDDVHHSARAGAITVGLIAFVLIIAVSGWRPLFGESGTEVRAEFRAANQVDNLTPVRVAGVDVGKVTSVEAGSTPGTSTVTMRITNEDVAVRRDARAHVRWRTVLGGNMFVDLEPGSPSASELGDGVIAADRTSSQVELDDLTQIYDGGTGEHQRDMLRGLRETFADPDAIGRSIETAGPALRTVGRGLAPLRGHESDDLPRLVVATAKTVAGLGRNPAELQALVAAADRTLGVTDARRRELSELLDLGPSSLASARATMRRLDTTLAHLDPLVGRLRIAAPSIAPAARAAKPALERTETLLRDIRPLLHAAGPTLTALQRASRSGVPFLNGLDPTVRRLQDELLPYLDERDKSTKLKNYEAVGPFFSSLDTVAAPFNDVGHLLQFAVLFGPNSATAPSVVAAARRCRREVPARGHGGCDAAAKVVARLSGGRR